MDDNSEEDCFVSAPGHRSVMGGLTRTTPDFLKAMEPFEEVATLPYMPGHGKAYRMDLEDYQDKFRRVDGYHWAKAKIRLASLNIWLAILGIQ